MPHKLKHTFLVLLSGVFLLLCTTPATPQSQSITADDLVRRADVVVVGKVTTVQSHWNSDKSRISTTVTITIEQQIKGQGNQTSLTISTPGGEVEGIGEWYSHTPKFKMNEEIIVFAEHDRNGGLRVTGGDQGKLTVKNDPSSGRKTVGDSEPLILYTSRLKSIVQAQSQE